jgi:polyisoprenyl-teichoic acid--peptidoglycan teichoic acid transferase
MLLRTHSRAPQVFFRAISLGLISLAAVLISGCGSSIFVGVEAAAADRNYTVVNHVANSPDPPLGHRSFRGNDNRAAPGIESRPLVSTTAGPAFNWQETENILLLGTDRRPGATNWRTDTIMVIGLDRARHRAAVLSIPRDLYVNIPGYGQGRINQVDYVGERVTRVPGGGPALVSQVLSETIGVATEHWVRVEMTGFEAVVDAVGGVTVHLDCPFYEPIFNLTTNSWDYFVLPAGPNHLDGETANWFVRLRLRDSDIGRAQRQRQFLWAMRNQFMSANLIVRIPELWSAFQESFSTDYTLLEIISLAQFGLSLEPGNVRSAGITLQELSSFTTQAGASVLVIRDPERVRAVVDGVWDAPAMADTNRQNPERCATVPQTGPWLPAQGADTEPAPETPAADFDADPEANTEAAIEPAIETSGAPETELENPVESSGAALGPREGETDETLPEAEGG